jgi:hypothetical protein
MRSREPDRRLRKRVTMALVAKIRFRRIHGGLEECSGKRKSINTQA